MTRLDARREVMITASNMGKVLAMSGAYMQELIDKRRAPPAQGVQVGGTGSVSTDWGNRWEPAAIAAYELRTGYDVARPGFLVHPTVPYVGGTPDGIVELIVEQDLALGGQAMALELGGVEVKCPEDAGNHLVVAANQQVPREYAPQVQTYLWITGAEWWDFVSFDPRCRVQELVTIRVYPDLDLHERMATRCALFWRHVLDEAVPQVLDALGGGVPVFFPQKR
jgi:predicted phage-related endonuclease